MIRLLHITFLSYIVFLLGGCNSHQKDKPIWEQVKIGDLAPAHSTRGPRDPLLKTINLDVHIFEIPAENISALDDVWQMLHTQPLQFNDYDAFKANSFLVGFGQTQMWNKIADSLQAADAKKAKTVSLLLLDRQTSDIPVTRLYRAQNIYFSTKGSLEGRTVGTGKLAWRIKAEKIPGSRGVCKIHALPVFSPPIGSSIPQLAAREKSRESLFTSAGFGLKMSPGDFVFLGPEKYSSDQLTLGSLFFSRPGPTPVVRTFLLVCSRINY